MPRGSTRRNKSDALELGSDGRRVDLQSAEVEVLLRACRKYRASIPSYLQSVQGELALVTELLEKLQQLAETGPSTAHTDTQK